MVNLFLTNMQLFALQDINNWTGLVWITCVLFWCFFSCLDSHSDGTHSLQRIHWLANSPEKMLWNYHDLCTGKILNTKTIISQSCVLDMLWILSCISHHMIEHTHTQTHTHSQSLTHSLTHSHTHTLTLSHSHTLSHTLTHSHTHTHTHILSLSLTHTLNNSSPATFGL